MPASTGEPNPVPPAQGSGRRLFRNTAINGLGFIPGLLINFLVVAFAIRRLGPEAYGIWVLAMSFSISSGYLSLSSFGLQDGIIKFVAERRGRGDTGDLSGLASSAVATLGGLAIAAVLVLMALALTADHLFNIPPTLVQPLRILLVLLAVEAAFALPGLTFQALLEGLQRYGLLRLIMVARQLLGAAIAVVALLAGGGVIGYGAAMVGASLLSTVAVYLAARHTLPGLRISPRLVHFRALRPLVGFSAWIFLGRLTGVGWRQMDRIILAVLLTSTLLTSYDIASRIQAATALTFTIVGSALFPTTASLFAMGSTAHLRELLLRGTRYSLLLSTPVTIGAIIMARPLIVGWVGHDFAGVTGATQLLLAGQLLGSVDIIAAGMLSGIGRVKEVTLLACMSMVVNLVLSIALAVPLGIVGVIVGTCVGWGLGIPFYVGLAIKDLKIGVAEFLSQAIVPVLPWAGLFTLVLIGLQFVLPPPNLLLVAAESAFAALVYAGCIWFFGIGEDERVKLISFIASGQRTPIVEVVTPGP